MLCTWRSRRCAVWPHRDRRGLRPPWSRTPHEACSPAAGCSPAASWHTCLQTHHNMQHEYSHEHDTLPNNHEQNLTIRPCQIGILLSVNSSLTNLGTYSQKHTNRKRKHKYMYFTKITIEKKPQHYHNMRQWSELLMK